MFGTVSTLTKNMKHLMLVGGLVIPTLFSCSNSGNSGPCDWYPEEFVRMEIAKVEVIQNDPVKYEIWLEFDRSGLGKELQPLSKWKDVDITPEFLDRNNIHPGIIYLGYVNELKEGDCEPFYVSFNSKFVQPE